MRAITIGLAAALLLPMASAAQAADVHSAEALFVAQDWEAAAAAFEAVIEATPDDSQAWFKLGASRHQLKQLDAAVAAYEEALRLGLDTPDVRLSGAVAMTRLGRHDAAFEWLGQAVGMGVTDNVLRGHPALRELAADPRFEPLVRRAQGNRPCSRFEYTLLDFWVGEWHVLDPRGNHVGGSRVQRVLDGCVVREEWISRAGTKGGSTSFWDPSKRRWSQVWVDDGGGLIRAEGEFRDGAMHFNGTYAEADGATELVRISLTPLDDGSVRQLIERSADGGVSWYQWFEGSYRKRAAGGQD